VREDKGFTWEALKNKWDIKNPENVTFTRAPVVSDTTLAPI